MASLVDTNILVYAHDPRVVRKQAVARRILRDGAAGEDLVVPHQAIVEFVAVVARPRADLGGATLVRPDSIQSRAEELARAFPVLYPDESVLLTALQGHAAYGLSWYDAHLWAYAEAHQIPEILSEDFEHGRWYGGVRVTDPFLVAADSVHELPPMYDERHS